MNATETVQSPPGVTQLEEAQRAFAAAVDAGLYPELAVEGQPTAPEFSIVIKGSHEYGVQHHEIEAALRIAEEHNARLWLGANDGKLSILLYEGSAR